MTNDSNPFDLYVGRIVVFGPKDGKARYEARVLETTADGWVYFEWPNSGARRGWRDVRRMMIHEVSV